MGERIFLILLCSVFWVLILGAALLGSSCLGGDVKLYRIATDQILREGWQLVPHRDGVVSIHYEDGGSGGPTFVKGTMECSLIYDRGLVVKRIVGPENLPDIDYMERKTDGLLYWGQENFESRTPIDVDGDLFRELEEKLQAFIVGRSFGETKELIEILEAAERIGAEKGD
tara:strand:- start:243 stop:755 length:513 start_codon:yes stop_codon:yes gene_type:complete